MESYGISPQKFIDMAIENCVDRKIIEAYSSCSENLYTIMITHQNEIPFMGAEPNDTEQIKAFSKIWL